ncbi:MAG: nitroreductase family protein, partial [Candidatus Bipolaricaulia bacterium]
MSGSEMSIFETIQTRRVVREFAQDRPVSEALLCELLVAARWAPSGGNRYINKFLVVRDPDTIEQVWAATPSMLNRPTALIVICIDANKAKSTGTKLDTALSDKTVWIDVGIAAQNIMLAAHALGLGACPSTSFSRGAIRTLLELPPFLIPEFIVQLGHPAPVKPRVMRSGASTRLRIEDITYW